MALLAAERAGDQTRIKLLQDALGDSADKIGSTEASLQAERMRMRAAFQAEADDVGFRLRIVIAAFTVTGALFGAFVLAIVRRG